MRDIKFRGKEENSGEWVYGYYCRGGWIDPVSGIETPRHIIHAEYLFDVDPDTVGQYTGLKDKNGKEIYEGDVVKTQFSSTPFGIVTWHDSGYFFVDTSFGKWRHFGDGYISIGDLMDKQLDVERVQLEVIGNICDNPELLEK